MFELTVALGCSISRVTVQNCLIKSEFSMLRLKAMEAYTQWCNAAAKNLEVNECDHKRRDANDELTLLRSKFRFTDINYLNIFLIQMIYIQ